MAAHVGPYEDTPDASEGANGVEAATSGMPDDAATRDPSSTTVGGAVANAMAQSEVHQGRLYGQGGSAGTSIDLPQ